MMHVAIFFDSHTQERVLACIVRETPIFCKPRRKIFLSPCGEIGEKSKRRKRNGKGWGEEGAEGKRRCGVKEARFKRDARSAAGCGGGDRYLRHDRGM